MTEVLNFGRRRKKTQGMGKVLELLEKKDFKLAWIGNALGIIPEEYA